MIHLLATSAAPVFVTTSTIVSMVVGTVIPLLIALVTRETLSPKIKTLLLLVLTTTSSVVTSVVTWPTNGAGWWHLVLTWLMTLMSAAASLASTWKPLGTTAAIHRATDRWVGLGRSPRAA